MDQSKKDASRANGFVEMPFDPPPPALGTAASLDGGQSSITLQRADTNPDECPICMEITGGPVLPLIHKHPTRHTESHRACERCRKDMKARGHECPWCRADVTWRGDESTAAETNAAAAGAVVSNIVSHSHLAQRIAEDEEVARRLAARLAAEAEPDQAGVLPGPAAWCRACGHVPERHLPSEAFCGRCGAALGDGGLAADEAFARRLAADMVGAAPVAPTPEMGAAPVAPALVLPPGIKPCPACGMLLEKISGDSTMMCGCEARPAGGTTAKAIAGGGCGHEFDFDTLAPIAFGSPGHPAHPRQSKFERRSAAEEQSATRSPVQAVVRGQHFVDTMALPQGIKQCPACGILLEKISGDATMMCGCEGRAAGGTTAKAHAGGGCGHEFNFDTLAPIAYGRPGNPAHPRQTRFYSRNYHGPRITCTHGVPDDEECALCRLQAAGGGGGAPEPTMGMAASAAAHQLATDEALARQLAADMVGADPNQSFGRHAAGARARPDCCVVC